MRETKAFDGGCEGGMMLRWGGRGGDWVVVRRWCSGLQLFIYFVCGCLIKKKKSAFDLI